MLFAFFFGLRFLFLFIFLQTFLFSPCWFRQTNILMEEKNHFCIQHDLYYNVNGMNFNGRKLHVLLFNYYYCILQLYSYRRNGWQCLTFDSIPSSVFEIFGCLVLSFYSQFYHVDRRTSSTLKGTHTTPILLFSIFIIIFISNQNNEKLREAAYCYIKL